MSNVNSKECTSGLSPSAIATQRTEFAPMMFAESKPFDTNGHNAVIFDVMNLLRACRSEWPKDARRLIYCHINAYLQSVEKVGQPDERQWNFQVVKDEIESGLSDDDPVFKPSVKAFRGECLDELELMMDFMRAFKALEKWSATDKPAGEIGEPSIEKDIQIDLNGDGPDLNKFTNDLLIFVDKVAVSWTPPVKDYFMGQIGSLLKCMTYMGLVNTKTTLFERLLRLVA